MFESRRETTKYIYLLDRITAFFALFIDALLMDDERHQPTGLVLRLNQGAHDEP
ncbi:hypothetical protein PUP68_17935 [Pseudomonas chlororaphis]|uniref:hypothetical protein n=1 Tax=Pseudomonas chlororaphis TaxID=587753 RepID=UPI0013DD8D35|nr:hypothetical protein [Pseudomonas chlororaphis]WDG78017.1 hypothetical protein PUP77_26925 [Pseudomonas chlororaphis]WDG82746.1 hypothetical protein PUP68_17935 [Pseudomonas chlororaphis]